MIQPHSGLRAAFVALLMVLFMQPLLATAQVTDINSAINKAGRERMLSQRMAKAYFQLGQGIVQVFLSMVVAYYFYRDGHQVARRVTDASNRVVRQLRAALGAGFPIIGVGGILSGADAVAKIEAGADAVQIYTGLIYRGPGLVGEVARALRRSRAAGAPAQAAAR